MQRRLGSSHQRQAARGAAVVNALAKAGMESRREWKHLSKAEGEASLSQLKRAPAEADGSKRKAPATSGGTTDDEKVRLGTVLGKVMASAGVRQN
jgi:hypothetical protein